MSESGQDVDDAAVVGKRFIHLASFFKESEECLKLLEQLCACESEAEGAPKLADFATIVRERDHG